MRKTVNYVCGLLTLVLASVTQSALATPSTSYYIYDESGHVIGEYDQNGNPIQEHIYLGDKPVAVVQGGTVDNVATDQLDAPRAVIDASKNVVWSWNSDPFGNGQPTGSLTYNLRFPGQYYDAETGHNYNYRRDYDPTTDRYIESDPTGLTSDLDTYTYANSDPEISVDPKGTNPYQYFSPGSQGASATIVCNGNDQIVVFVPPNYDLCIRDCADKHEQVHIADLYSLGSDACKGQLATTVIGFAEEDVHWISELTAFNTELSCLLAKAANSKDCPTCRNEIQDRIDAIKIQIRDFANRILSRKVP